MALLNETFDSSTVEPSKGYDPIPPGWYVGEIRESEMKETVNQDGHYLQLSIHVTEGKFENRVVWARLNLDNQNPTSVEIARRDLSAICRAVKTPSIADSEELHGIPFEFKVSVRPAKGQYDASNDVKGYRAHTASAGQPQAEPLPMDQRPNTAPASTSAPWD